MLAPNEEMKHGGKVGGAMMYAFRTWALARGRRDVHFAALASDVQKIKGRPK